MFVASDGVFGRGARMVNALVIRMIVLQQDLRLELKATEAETATELDEGGVEYRRCISCAAQSGPSSSPLRR